MAFITMLCVIDHPCVTCPLPNVNAVLPGLPNELPVPFHGQAQYSHQIGATMKLTPVPTPSNSGTFSSFIISYSCSLLCSPLLVQLQERYVAAAYHHFCACNACFIPSILICNIVISISQTNKSSFALLINWSGELCINTSFICLVHVIFLLPLNISLW